MTTKQWSPQVLYSHEIEFHTALLLEPTWQASVADVMELVKQPLAAVIRQLRQGKLGGIVTRIELLSPSNKKRGGQSDSYRIKRAEALDTGIPLVEIDYLHELPSLIRKLPRYPTHTDAYPYNLIVSDPRPNWSDGQVRVYGFNVSQSIKQFPIPLADDETLIFDLNTVYQHSFQAGRWGNLLDYTAEPERFNTYSPADQQVISTLMAQHTPGNPAT